MIILTSMMEQLLLLLQRITTEEMKDLALQDLEGMAQAETQNGRVEAGQALPEGEMGISLF